MKKIGNALVLATLTLMSTAASAQLISLDNVTPFPLAVSASVAAVSINPATGNVTARSLTGAISQCGGSEAFAMDKSVLGGNTALVINQSGRIPLQTTPITYLNRSVGQGRRVVILRVGQPLLCVDFATPPGGAVNPVGFKITDINNETSAAMYAGISSFGFLTNGAAASSFVVTAGAQLACCTMLPAANASCFQGSTGGLQAPAMASAAAPDKGGAANLSVVVDGPGSVLPGTDLVYSIVVSNTGATAMSGVRVRDWFQKTTSGFAVAFSNGAWTCAPTAGGSCGSAGGTGNIDLANVSLNAGASVILTVSRTLAAFAPMGSTFSVSAAAFAPPAANESDLSDNQDVLSGVAEVPELLLGDGFE